MDGHLELGGHPTLYWVLVTLLPASRAPVIPATAAPARPTTTRRSRPAGGSRRALSSTTSSARALGPSARRRSGVLDRRLFEHELDGAGGPPGHRGALSRVGQSGRHASPCCRDQPEGRAAPFVAADSPASIPGFVAGCNELLDALDPAVRAVIREGDAAARPSTPEFEAAAMEFLNRTSAALDPWPTTSRALRRHGTGPDGLRDHERPDGVHRRGDDQGLRHHRPPRRDRGSGAARLGRARRCPPALVEAMHQRLRHGERVLFEDSSHMPHIEEPERFLAVVQDFLERSEAA